MWAFLGGLFKSIALALGMAQAKQQRDEGAIAQREKDDSDELAAIRKGNDAAADPVSLQRVRDKYQTDRPA